MAIIAEGFNIEEDIKYVHRGMAFLDSGRELGYMVVIKYSLKRVGSWQWAYGAFLENNGNCIKPLISFTGGVTENGRSYNYKFVDLYGQNVYIE